jgi:hypothetical protein
MRNLQVRPVRDLRNKYSEIEEYQHNRYVAEKLREAEAEEKSDKPDWIEYKTLFRNLKKKYQSL